MNRDRAREDFRFFIHDLLLRVVLQILVGSFLVSLSIGFVISSLA